MARVKVGVVGVGSLGQHHARIYGSTPGAEMVGLYDRDQVRAREVAEKNGTLAFESLDELADAVDALSVVVPTDLHYEISRKLIGQGVNLLIEKPITTTTAQAEELVALADENRVILQVGHIERFNPVMSYLEEEVLRESSPKFIEAHRLAPYPPLRGDAPPRGTEVSVILDLMIHDLEIILHLVKSPIKDLRVVGVPVLSDTEDIANVRIEFENGCVANVTTSRISPESLRKIRVFTDQNYISLDYQNQSGQIHSKCADGISVSEVPVEQGDQLERELAAFVKSVSEKDCPVVTGEQASRALQIATEIVRLTRDDMQNVAPA